MASSLIDILIKKQGNIFKNVFEVGCGTGFLTDEILSRLNFEKLILNDLTDNFTTVKPNEYIKGDITQIETPLDLDLILSNAVFQWISDYELLFKKLRNSLSMGGIVCFSYFGKNNFIQIKNTTGVGLEYPCLDEFINKNGFKILYFEEELTTLYFKNVKELLEHIKLTGVKTKNKIWTKKDFNDFYSKYLKDYKDDLGFELTYHPVYYVLEAV